MKCIFLFFSASFILKFSPPRKDSARYEAGQESKDASRVGR